MISIVNKTTWLNPTNAASPVTITIPAVTAGNTIVMLSGTNIQNTGDPTAQLGGTETLTKFTGTASGVVAAYYLLSAVGGETTMVLSVFSSPAWAVIYEITPCTFVTANAVLGVVSGGSSVNPGPSGLTGSGNCAYFVCSASGSTSYSPAAAYGTVNSPYIADYTYAGLIYGGAAPGTGIFASQLNVTGTQTPTFNMSAHPTSYSYYTAGIVMQDAGPTGPTAPQIPSAWMRHMMINLSWPAENQPNEIYSYSIYGSLHTEG